MFEVIDKLHEVRVCAYHQDWIKSQAHTFSRMEIERSEIPLENMVGALDKFKPFLKEDDAS